MEYPVEEGVRKAAKGPHELFMINLAVFHLLLGPGAIIAFGGGALVVPVGLSLLVMLYTAWRRRARISGDMAIRLAKAFGSTTETWIRLQAAYDVAQAQAREDQIEVERYERQPA